MDIKTAAERLFKIAEAIEKEAFEKTKFVCDKCNHTASLSTINARRKQAAVQHGVKNVNVVTVNEKVACPACDGVMSYVATEESSKFWLESAEDNPEKDPLDIEIPAEEPKAEEPKDDAPVGESEVFQPVDEQKTDAQLDAELGGAAPAPEDKPVEEAPAGEAPAEDVPVKEEPLPEDSDKEVPPVVEEEVPAEEKPKKKSKKDKVEFPKEDVPKFEKMPKEAADDYAKALAKYAL